MSKCSKRLYLTCREFRRDRGETDEWLIKTVYGYSGAEALAIIH